VEVLQAGSGNEALGMTLEHEFCMAIVDVQMPEMDGYELVDLLRGNETTVSLPVIFVSAIFSDEYHHRKGYDSGAVDFMSKPFIPEILLSKVKVFIELYNQRRKLQNTVDELNRANLMLTRRAIQLETSSKVGQQVTSILDLDKLLPQVIRIIQAQFNYTMVGIWLANDTKDNIALEASTLPQASEKFSILTNHKGLVAKSYINGSVMLENKASTNTTYVPTKGMQLVGSELALPLKIQNEVLGVLDIQSERPQAFIPEDVVALETLASQIVIAIRNARLYSKVQ
jgi:CheY-like chemotaxis protein/putative methionine-R-sulfoxide reductase with GAF domain